MRLPSSWFQGADHNVLVAVRAKPMAEAELAQGDKVRAATATAGLTTANPIDDRRSTSPLPPAPLPSLPPLPLSSPLPQVCMSMTKTGVKIRGPYSDERTFNYDHCFWSGRGNTSHSKIATQEDIYEALGRRYDAKMRCERGRGVHMDLMCC